MYKDELKQLCNYCEISSFLKQKIKRNRLKNDFFATFLELFVFFRELFSLKNGQTKKAKTFSTLPKKNIFFNV
jgi:hypothetical protein